MRQRVEKGKGNKNPSNPFGDIGGVAVISFLSILEEVLGKHFQAGVLTDGSGAVAPFPAIMPVVMGARLANHSGGSVRDFHPLPQCAPWSTWK
jgi:hypothetical protein